MCHFGSLTSNAAHLAMSSLNSGLHAGSSQPQFRQSAAAQPLLEVVSGQYQTRLPPRLGESVLCASGDGSTRDDQDVLAVLGKATQMKLGRPKCTILGATHSNTAHLAMSS